MSELLQRAPFGPRDDARLLGELSALTREHLARCEPYRRMWPVWSGAASSGAESFADLPFVHVGVFKHLLLESAGAKSGRTLQSSGTTGAARSRIVLDDESSQLQAASSAAILGELVGRERAPLLVVEHAGALRQRGEISARVAAAMALRPLASEITFLLESPDRADSIRWPLVVETLARAKHVRVYGFTSALWQAWGSAAVPEVVRNARIDFVHSGGWKRLEAESVTRETFDSALLARAGEGSRVIDYYGLVEQIGVIFPLCREGFRHVPVWAAVLVRDPFTLAPLDNTEGMLQLMNVLAHGAPYHAVLTEDVGALEAGDCPCGIEGQRFRLLGRVPKAETRGCASV